MTEMKAPLVELVRRDDLGFVRGDDWDWPSGWPIPRVGDGLETPDQRAYKVTEVFWSLHDHNVTVYYQ